tara:strand:- start:231 stop:380 length:150 start_codon:yes stop_codon:yes gene_type:complete
MLAVNPNLAEIIQADENENVAIFGRYFGVDLNRVTAGEIGIFADGVIID